MDEILSVLALRAAGHAFTEAEIQARIGEKQPALASTRGRVAVIPVHGVIAHRIGSMDDTSGGTSTERIAAMIRQVGSDESIGTIVYDINTPGGTIPGVQELAAEMFALRGTKHQVAVANSLIASAGYWLASQADEIVSIPSGQVGSIGVFTAHQDLSEALKRQGISVTLISAGKHKVEGNPFEPLSDEARAVIQGRVDAAYAQFVKDVARGRGVTPAAVRSGYGEGRALSAVDAKAAGLIDGIATMEETLARVSAGRPASSGRRGMRAEDEDLPLVADALAPALTAEQMTALVANADRRRRLERF